MEGSQAMNPSSTRPTIKDLELESNEEIQLYKELIRVIEKDIDEITEGDTKSGWTSWAIVGGIIGALLLLFGETRKLSSFPADEVIKLSLVIFLFFNIIAGLYRIFSATQLTSNIGPGRIRWSKEVYLPYLPTWIYRFIIFLLGAWLASTLLVPLSFKIIAVSAFSSVALFLILILIMSVRDEPIGRPNIKHKVSLVMVTVFLLLSSLTVMLLGSLLSFPVGEAATQIYILAGLTVTIVVLIEFLIDSMSPSRLLSSLQDLRNDIIFLRIDIDEALKRYEVLAEGETLPDAMKGDLDSILIDLRNIEHAHSNMEILIAKMDQELYPVANTIQEKQRRSKQLDIYKDSYLLHKAMCEHLARGLNPKFNGFNKKLAKVLAVSGDLVSENNLRSMLQQRLQELDNKEKQLEQARRMIEFYIDNPDQLPPRTSLSKETDRADERTDAISSDDASSPPA
jgi:hypothetical protein